MTGRDSSKARPPRPNGPRTGPESYKNNHHKPPGHATSDPRASLPPPLPFETRPRPWTPLKNGGRAHSAPSASGGQTPLCGKNCGFISPSAESPSEPRLVP